ncbi:hypothetical protein [Yersinia mollaretii]|uniref:Uncharacterized protein n=1 Tax=Yersinia mollaretii (strain ATCC 43969 / DSM 18520 / CIP 103324 / CNY 7263 / WAIP 204) TaxID=349967 RepID=A0ABP2EC76_YERMW|nr:hypothetical protein [Yersinia mollaretii]EEQ08796.1 hypothetical protein ymoll0001_27380 [Yersinia mollaretii ATCC 43969]
MNSLENSDATFSSTFQKAKVKDSDVADLWGSPIREISFADLNALDNYYHLDIIGDKKEDVIFQGSY